MTPNFIHLHVHSEYSLADSLVRIKSLVETVAKLKMPTIALTDQSNLFAVVKFYQAAEAVGIKPIIGVDAWLRNYESQERPFRLILLAQNSLGYGNLIKLVSLGYQKGQYLGKPYLERSWVEMHSTGLILLSGGREGDVGQALLAGRTDRAEELVKYWTKFFEDRYYLELTRTGREQEEEYIYHAVNLAISLDIPVVATNDVCFIEAKDFDAHETRVCIHQGHTLDDPLRPHYYSAQQYLRSPAEMAELFSDLPEALENSVEIARRCNVEISLGKNYLPQFPVKSGSNLNEYLCEQAREGLAQRFANLSSNQPNNRYTERLERELAVIIQMGFPGYFLIVADFIQWAKNQGIPVGPGRGSGAGSLVAYALRITDIDPLPYDLLFERFLNPERVSMPDFDIDFCMDGRDKVIDYVAERYGRNAVSQIITYGSMAAKVVVRDVGRALGHAYGFVDRIAKLIPFEIGITLKKALQDTPELRALYESEEDVTNLIDMAQILEGLTRNVGRHAGGVVIAPGNLTDFTPLYCEANGEFLVTQFDKDDVEQVGLVKFDFLGLRTLTIIDWALKDINKLNNFNKLPPVDISRIPLDDPKSFELLKRGDTTAVFQLESKGMKELIKKLKPDRFEDIIALVALYRPGPLGSGMVDDFINRKHGTSKVSYPHSALETILKPTYGTILYQEQVMQIAQTLAGFSLGRADLLRRAMGKKKPEEMAKQREVFQQGAIARGVDAGIASHIFDLMEKFSEYGFNKSHSAAYALISYQTAWLKAHYPAAFMAAVLSSDMDKTDKVVTFIEECRHMQLNVCNPDVNTSELRFTVGAKPKDLIYGLGAIKGMGTAAIDKILEVRNNSGEFKDLFDFCRRVDLQKVNKRVIDAMIRSGAMGKLGPNRATLTLQLPLALKLAEQHNSIKNAGLSDLFGMDAPTAPSLPDANILPTAVKEWDDAELLQEEKSTLGLYLTGHPINRFIEELKLIATSTISELLNTGEELHGNMRSSGRKSQRKTIVAGLVIEAHHRNTPKGRMGSLLLDDRSGRMEVTIFPELYQDCREMLTADKILIAVGQLTYDEYRGNLSLRAEQLYELEQLRTRYVESVYMRLNAQTMADHEAFVIRLHHILKSHQNNGRCPIFFEYCRNDTKEILRFGPTWQVLPTEIILKELKELLGQDAVWFKYGRNTISELQSESVVKSSTRH